ncbi:MAG: hypothetical protein K8S23_07005 [Candidatus Cloacimonetes bacterium]|nr:hypothetical protein [Candidatus Cloacimonadota bacterium]
MQIANPIYDVVFKYLMEDNKIAKFLISAIIDEKIISLDFLPREQTLELEKISLTVYRMDFSAKIETETGSKQVIIEIQKAKFTTDIIRFRRYLGEQYSPKEKVKELNSLPIITIYFLGHKLEHIKSPLIKVKREYYDGITGKKIIEREKFIECLMHDSYVIQIPYLHKKYQTETEQLLSVFNQDNVTNNSHILNINPDNFSEKQKIVILRLQRAIAEQKVRAIMDLEDDILEEFDNLERKIERQEMELKKNKNEMKEKDGVIDSKDKKLEIKNKELNEKERILTENQKELEEKEKIIIELKKQLNLKS